MWPVGLHSLPTLTYYLLLPPFSSKTNTNEQEEEEDETRKKTPKCEFHLVGQGCTTTYAETNDVIQLSTKLVKCLIGPHSSVYGTSGGVDWGHRAHHGFGHLKKWEALFSPSLY